MFNLFGLSTEELKLRAELIGKITMSEPTFQYLDMFTMKDYETYRSTLRNLPADFYIYHRGIVPDICAEQLSETRWGEYIAYAVKTWNHSDAPILQIANACAGITGELAECYLNPTLDEMGDLLYYRNIFRYLMADDFDFTSPLVAQDTDKLMYGISMISDVGKKIGFHNKLSDPKTNNRYLQGIEIVDTFIQNWCSRMNLSHWDVMDYNIEKLKSRHGDSFNPNC